jgi:PAS domain S-box-containing protein
MRSRKEPQETGLVGLCCGMIESLRLQATSEDSEMAGDPTGQQFEWLPGGGEMGERTRSFDWSATTLGPVADWPRSLRTIVSVILTSRHPMFLWWGPELIQFYNDAYSASLGTERHPAALGGRGRDFWGEIWEAIGPQIELVMTRGESTWNEDHLVPITRNNRVQEVYWTYSYSPVLDDEARIGGCLVTVQETTRRVQSERRMAMLRALADQTNATGRSPDAVCRIATSIFRQADADVAFSLIYLFEEERGGLRLVETFGEIPPEASPEEILDSESGEADEPGGWPILRVARSGEPEVLEDLESRFGALPGGRWPEPARCAMILPIIRTGQERPYGVVVTGVSPRQSLDHAYRDFFGLVAAQLATSLANAREYLEERLRAEALAKLDRAKTIFFSNVSHEFRTPLTLMLGPMQEALSKPDGALRGRDLQRAHRSALRLLKLVNTLLDFSRIEAGRARALFEKTDVAAFTAELASTFRSAIEKAGMRLIVDAPSIDAEAFVDREMWEKIVLNLLSNAFKFTLEGTIEVRLARHDESFQLTVRDTGSGIPVSELQNVFERFRRIEGTRRRTTEGTGIGLALVQELVRLHGGEVGVESVEGKGTTFTITIPLGSSHLPADHIALSRGVSSGVHHPELYIEEAMQWLPPEQRGEADGAAAPTGVASATGRPRIVLADDNPDIRDYINRLLADDYDVIAVRDGIEALEAVQREEPDLVVSDLMMPNLDGFGLLKALRGDAATAALPVLLVSARAGEEARLEGFEAGADDYLVKPFTARELQARVTALLTLARLRRESDEALREIFMKAPAAIAALRGPDHRFQVANPIYMQLIGERDVIGKPLREALPEIEGQGFVELLDQVYASGEPFVGREVPARLHRNGRLEEVFLDFLYQPLRYRDGRVSGIFVHAIDVTGQVRARQEVEQANRILLQQEEALRESEQRYRAMADLSPQVVWTCDATGANTYVNRWFLSYTGLTEEDAAGRGWERAFHPDHQVRAADVWARALSGGQAYEDEIPLRRGEDGSFRWHLFRGLPRRDASGQLLNWIGVATDIHDMKQAQEALREADRMKDEFLATLSHELRTPLTAILGWTQILLASQQANEQVTVAMETISRSAQAQSRLIEDVLDISRITTGKMRLERRALELPPVIEAAVETVRPAADAKEIDLRLTLDVSIGPLLIDPDRVQQIVWNLLSNAIKFSRPRTAVEVTLRRTASHAVIEVRDQGPGIAREFIPHLFERFRQEDSSSRRSYSGLGLGLSLTKNLTELHGGTVEVESAEGDGALFRVNLPIGSGAPQADRLPDARERGEQKLPLLGIRVLFVDDSEDARLMFQTLLQKSGADVTTAASVDEALATLEHRECDIVITDVAMPRRDGYDLLREIRSSTGGAEKLPILALTAQARGEDEQRARSAGFESYLRKPIDGEQLVREIARHFPPPDVRFR